MATSTTRWGWRKPANSPLPGDAVDIQADLNAFLDDLDDNFGAKSCTEATKPSHKLGREIWTSDTKRFYKSTGSEWVFLRGETDPTSFRVYRATGLTIAAAGYTTVPWTGADWNSTPGVNTTTGIWTVPVTAEYQINCRVGYDNNNNPQNSLISFQTDPAGGSSFTERAWGDQDIRRGATVGDDFAHVLAMRWRLTANTTCRIQVFNGAAAQFSVVGNGLETYWDAARAS